MDEEEEEMLKRAIAMSMEEEKKEEELCPIRHQRVGELLQKEGCQKRSHLW